MKRKTLHEIVVSFCDKQSECDSCIFFDSCGAENGYERFLKELMKANGEEIEENDGQKTNS